MIRVLLAEDQETVRDVLAILLGCSPTWNWSPPWAGLGGCRRDQACFVDERDELGVRFIRDLSTARVSMGP
jgi:hypothetical protein